MVNGVVTEDEITAMQQFKSASKGVNDMSDNQIRQQSAFEVMMFHVVLFYFLALVLLNVGHGKTVGIVSICLLVMAFILAARYICACVRYRSTNRDFEREQGDMLSYLSDLEQRVVSDTAVARISRSMFAMRVMDLRNLKSPKEYSSFLYLGIAMIVSLGLVAIFCVLVYFEVVR